MFLYAFSSVSKATVAYQIQERLILHIVYKHQTSGEALAKPKILMCCRHTYFTRFTSPDVISVLNEAAPKLQALHQESLGANGALATRRDPARRARKEKAENGWHSPEEIGLSEAGNKNKCLDAIWQSHVGKNMATPPAEFCYQNSGGEKSKKVQYTKQRY